MTSDELTKFLEENENIEYQLEPDAIAFRNTNLQWYQSDEGRATRIENWKLEKLTAGELMEEINRGLQVEGITRITGYFTKTASWNKGKRGELKERRKFNV